MKSGLGRCLAHVAGPLVLLAFQQSAPAGESARFRKIDAHVHWTPGAVPQLLDMMDKYGIDVAINFSGGAPGEGLEEQVELARLMAGRMYIFATLDWSVAHQGPGYGQELAAQLKQAKTLGAIGLKIPKGLGLAYRDHNGNLIAVDDPELDVVFDEAGKLGMPVAIHTGDPVAFWQAPTPKNERYDELRVHPGWSYAGKPAPSWEELFAVLERRIARHPNTTFISVHFGNAAEYPERVAALLDKYPNLFLDLAARIPELGRHSAQMVRGIFEKYPDRILFGTDLGVGLDPEDLMLGSAGEKPPTPADIERFFSATWRYLETEDRGFPHPTPIQGQWTIDGLGLNADILRKIYSENALRLLRISLPSPDARAKARMQLQFGTPEHPCVSAPAIVETKSFLVKHRDLYESAISRAVDWLSDLDVDPQELRQHQIKGKKKLVELLDGYYRVWTIMEGPRKAALLARIKEVVAVTYEDRYHDMLELNDRQFKQDATSYLRAALLMERLGLDTKRYREEIKKVHPRLNSHMRTRGPNQRRVFHWYYEHFGLSEPFSLDTALEEGVIARRVAPEDMTDDQAYGLTHEIFGPYEYGDRLDVDPFTSSEKGYLSFALDELAGRYLKQHNPDLLAEILSCMRMLGFFDLRRYAQGLQYLLTSQERDGSWQQHRGKATTQSDELTPYRMTLHTTTVAIDALSLAFYKPWNQDLKPTCF